MKRLWTVARHEFRGFVDHPTAYILIIAFLALGLFLAFRSLYATSTATLRPFFDLLPWLFAVFIPAVTMRSLAEEQRSHTLEWLMAQPMGEAEVVLGKFIGNWLFALLAVAGTLPTALGVLLASEADPGIVVAQYTGSALLAAQMPAVGLWASSATKNQITAFILATAACLGLVLMGTPVVQIGLPPLLGGAVARLSVVTHFENVARGVVDLRDVLYFASMAGLFLTLAVALVSRHRLSHVGGDYRRLRVGAAVVLALVVVVNLLGGHVRGRLDLTRGNLYTLADGTREILADLDDLVSIKLFTSRELPPEVQLTVRDVRDLVADFRRVSGGSVQVEELNPDDDEDAADEANSLGIAPIEFNVLREDEFQVRRGYFGLAVLYADEQEVIPLIDRTDDLEFRLASAVSSMTREERPGLAFVSGFGAKSAFQYSALREGLADRYDIRTANLEGDSVPEIDADSVRVLVVAAPNETLDSTAVARIERYVDAGGAAFLLLERNEISMQAPVAEPVTTGLEGFLEARGVRLNSGMVYDLRSSENISLGQRGFFNLVRAYPLWPIAFRAAEHPMTRDLSNLTFGWAASFEITDSTVAMPLWETSAAGGAQPAGSSIDPEALLVASDPNELGVRTLAVVGDPDAAGGGGGREGGGTAGRVVAVGDGNFLEDQFVRANPQNLIFAANAVDWLAQDDALIRIRSKNRAPPALVFESDFRKNALKWGSLIGIPLLFALGGALRVAGRPARARRRWQEVQT
jgi:ABC-2 type transport system permease protein